MSAEGTLPRRRQAWRIAGVFALVLLVVLVALPTWLLRSEGGRDFVLARVATTLAEAGLRWERVEGPLAGPMTWHGLAWQGEDGLRVEVARLRVDIATGRLLRRELQVRALQAEGVHVWLADADDADSPADTAPFSLPSVDAGLPIRLDALRVDDFALHRADHTLLRAVRIEAAGQLIGPRIDLDRFDADTSEGRLDAEASIDTRDGWSGHLRADWRGPAERAHAARLRLQADGSPASLALVIEGEAPDPLELRIDAEDLHGAAPRWRLVARTGAVDPAAFGVDAPALSRLRLDARGEGLAMDVEGEVATEAFAVAIAPSSLALDDTLIALAPLDLRLLDGRARIEGEVDLGQNSPRVDLAAVLSGIQWQPAAGEPALRADGRIAVQGLPEDWRLDGRVQLARDGLDGEIALEGRGDMAGLRLDRLALRTDGGRLEGSGTLRWDPRIAWSLEARLSALDPGWLLPDYPGAMDGRLQSQGELRDDGIHGRLRIEGLAGQLRERRLDGHLAVDWQGSTGEVDTDLGIGQSRIRGGGRYDPAGHRIDLRLAPLELADLLPEARGRLEGEVRLRGPDGAPGIAADLAGGDLAWNGERVERLAIEGRLSPRDADGSLRARLDGAVLGGLAFDSVDLDVAGSLAEARAGVLAQGQIGELSLSADLAQAGEGWRGRLLDLRLAPPQGAPWSLQAPADFRIAGAAATLDEACLNSAGARLCIDADWPREARIEGNNLPLALLDPWLAAGGSDLAGYGQLGLSARIGMAGERLRGEATVSGEAGGVRLDLGDEPNVLGYRRLILGASLDGDAIEATLDAVLDDGGTVEATLATGLADDAPLAAELRLAIDDLTWLELFSPDIVRPAGRLRGDLRLGGSRAEPTVDGSATLSGFTTELPALGITLREGEFDVGGDDRGRFRLDGSVASGQGRLEVEGRMRPLQGATRFVAIVRGQDVLLADTPDLRAVVSPDVTIAYANERLRVRGRVDVPSARIDLERLETTTQASPDVVVLDPVDPVGGAPVPLDLELTIAPGDRVELVGFGLDGRLGGQLRVRQLPGQAATASGGLSVAGTYEAYGRELEITRARLSWANAPVDNPALDIVAQRRFDEVTVGLRVRGTALRPESAIFSDPAMESTEALSWLVLGRPLRSAGAEEGQQLNAAAMALGAGGNLIAQQIGARLGLDEAGVSDSRALGGATFTVGKYLSPRLFVSYGVSLLGTGQVLTLKYLLGRGFDIKIESGIESRGSLNWRLER